MGLISLLSCTASLTAERPLTYMTLSWCHVGTKLYKSFRNLARYCFLSPGSADNCRSYHCSVHHTLKPLGFSYTTQEYGECKPRLQRRLSQIVTIDGSAQHCSYSNHYIYTLDRSKQLQLHTYKTCSSRIHT